MDTVTDRQLTAEEAAERLGYHVNHLYRLLAQGKIEGQKLANKVWLLSQAEVDRVRALQDEHGRLPRKDRV